MIRNNTTIEFSKIHYLNELSKSVKTISLEELYQVWEKEKEKNIEIFKSIENVSKSLKGDCDDFTTLVINDLKNRKVKNITVFYFINKNNYAYHVAGGIIENEIITIYDIYKSKNIIKTTAKEIRKIYPKAVKIIIFKISEEKIKKIVQGE